jgi:hypothetical protein
MMVNAPESGICTSSKWSYWVFGIYETLRIPTTGAGKKAKDLIALTRNSVRYASGRVEDRTLRDYKESRLLVGIGIVIELYDKNAWIQWWR